MVPGFFTMLQAAWCNSDFEINMFTSKFKKILFCSLLLENIWSERSRIEKIDWRHPSCLRKKKLAFVVLNYCITVVLSSKVYLGLETVEHSTQYGSVEHPSPAILLLWEVYKGLYSVTANATRTRYVASRQGLQPCYPHNYVYHQFDQSQTYQRWG